MFTNGMRMVMREIKKILRLVPREQFPSQWWQLPIKVRHSPSPPLPAVTNPPKKSKEEASRGSVQLIPMKDHAKT